MTDIVERLRGHADRVQQVEEGWGPADALCAAARAAADEIERLRAAASQASFCLRTLLPDDPDAVMTVTMLRAALEKP